MIIFVIGALLLAIGSTPNTQNTEPTTKELVERGHYDRSK